MWGQGFHLWHLSLPKRFHLFILVSSVSKSLQCLISTLTQGGRGDHLFRLTCSVVLWEGRNTANKYHWCVWGVLTVSGPHWVCSHSQHVCFPGLPHSGSRLLCRGYLKRALDCVHFPGLSCSGSDSRVLHKTQTWLGLRFVPFPGLSSSGDQVLGEHTVPGGLGILIISRVPAAQFPGCAVEHRLRCAVCLLWGADLRLRPSWRMSTVQDPRKTWLATGSLLAVW